MLKRTYCSCRGPELSVLHLCQMWLITSAMMEQRGLIHECVRAHARTLTHTHTHTQTYKHTRGGKGERRGRDRETVRQRDRDRQTERDRQTDRQTEKESVSWSKSLVLSHVDKAEANLPFRGEPMGAEA